MKSKMKCVLGLFSAVAVLSTQAISAGPHGKGHGQEWDRKAEKAEKQSIRNGSGPGKTGLAGKVKSLLDQADELAREGSTKAQIDRAASLAREALDISEQRNIPNGIARAYVIMGLIHLWHTEYDKALEDSKEAIAPAKRAGNCRALAAATKNLGMVYKAWGQYDKAIESLAEAIRLAEGCGDNSLGAWATLNLGQVHGHQGRYRDALKVFDSGLAEASRMGNRELEGYIQTAIGVAYVRTGQYTRAATCLESALTLGEKVKRPRIQQEALSELGRLYLAWGKYREAADYFQKTLERARIYGDKRTETSALLSQGEVYAKWGRYTDAMACFQEALTMSKSTGLVLQQVRILRDMGTLCSSRGQYHKATKLFEHALELSQQLGTAQLEGNILTNLGRVYHTWDQYDQALTYFEKALAIFKKIGVPTGPVAANIGNLYLDLGQEQKAEPFIQEAGYPAPEARLCLFKSDYECAKNSYRRLLEFAERSWNADNLFVAYTGLGMACEGANDLVGAESQYRKAVEHTEEIRSGLDPAERETFFDVTIEGFCRTAPYEGLARVLVKMDRPIEALKQSEYTRARIFAESISRRGESIGLDVPRDVLEADSLLSDQLSSLTKNLQKAHETHDQEAIAFLEPQVEDAKEAFAAHVRLLRERYPLFASTRYPQPMELAQAALESDEWVLEYHVTDPGLIIYLAKGKTLKKCLFKPVQRKEIEAMIRKFREPLEIRTGDDIARKLESFDFATGKKLSDVLLGDFLSVLPQDSRIILAPDDSLGVLPFEMLPLNDKGRIATEREIPYCLDAEFFGDRNPISYYQSITALTLARTYGTEKKPSSNLLVFADPVFQTKDERYQDSQKTMPNTGPDMVPYKELTSLMGDGAPNSAGISRLALTSKLADSLAKMYGSSAECYTGLQANKERFLKMAQAGVIAYDKIVFATHGYFGKDLPGIKEPVLLFTLVPPGIDGYLRMTEVTGLRIDVDLVALTACQTGLGKKISGEGTMGMGRAFQYSGAKSVLMSLWSVEQSASVNLIDSFFRHLKQGKSKLDALKSARQEIRGQGYDHPFFWAPFILVGEAR